MSPASTLGYGYDDEMSTTLDNNLTPGVLAGHEDPFDFDSELALIQDNELTDERTKAITESLKEIQLELVARCLTPAVSFGDDAVESTATSAPVLTDNDDFTISSSLYDAYSVLEGKILTLKSMQSVPLDNDNMLVTLEMQDPVQLPGIDMSSPNHPALDLLLEKLSTSLKVVYGSATVKNNQVFIPEPLQGSVSVVQEDPIISGTDVSPVHEKVPVKTVTQPVPLKGKGGPHFQYDRAIAKLKEAGAEVPPGVPVIHGEVHKDCFPPLQRNYGAGIKYLLTGDEGAKNWS